MARTKQTARKSTGGAAPRHLLRTKNGRVRKNSGGKAIRTWPESDDDERTDTEEEMTDTDSPSDEDQAAEEAAEEAAEVSEPKASGKAVKAPKGPPKPREFRQISKERRAENRKWARTRTDQKGRLCFTRLSTEQVYYYTLLALVYLNEDINNEKETEKRATMRARMTKRVKKWIRPISDMNVTGAMIYGPMEEWLEILTRAPEDDDLAEAATNAWVCAENLPIDVKKLDMFIATEKAAMAA